MSAAKHTPGPWKAGRPDMATQSEVCGKWVYAGDKYIAIASQSDAEDWEEVLANANLIASAPDLLAFAKWAMGQFCGDSGTGESHWGQFPEFASGAAAIAKTEGGAA